MLRWVMVLCVGLVATGRVFAAPVGMACQVTGTPQFISGGATKPLHLLQRVQSGDAVRCGAGATAVIVLFGNGSRFKIGAGGQGKVTETAVQGATAMGGLSGPSNRVAKALGGSRSGAFMARPATQQHGAFSLQIAEPNRGWMLETERHVQWDPIPGAATYIFSLFDQNDNVVWTVRPTEPTADYPADGPALKVRRPYVWRLSALGQTGKPVPDVRWGMITFLAQADADQMLADAKALRQQSDAAPEDTTPLVLLAELYRQYGVYEKALGLLEDQRLAHQPGGPEAIDEAYLEVSTYTYALSHLPKAVVDGALTTP